MRFYGFYNNWRRVKKWSVALLALALTFIMVAVSSCINGNGVSVASSIDIRFREINRSGLQILLIPKDDASLLVKAEGSVSSKLWFQIGLTPDIEKGGLIQEWNDIQITGEDYTQFLGAVIDLDYNEEKDFLNIYGLLEVTLILSDGTILDIEEYDVMISEEYSC